MSTEEMLLRAICAEPQDDTPRLALADYYLETGRWERAEFIQRSVAHHYRPFSDPLYWDEQFWMSQWVDRHGLDWVPEVSGIKWHLACLGVWGEHEGLWVQGKYSRGFVSEIHCSMLAWHRLWSDLTASLPIGSVVLWRGEGRNERWGGGLVLDNGDGTTTTVGSNVEWRGWAAKRWPQIEFIERQTTRAESNHL